MSLTMPLKPRISEKAYGLSQTDKVYVFEVPKDANKLSVSAAIESQFGVNVISVNILNLKGKEKQQYRKRGKRNRGTRPDVKKAYVTLLEGQEIAIFPKEEDDKQTSAEPVKSKKATRSAK